MVTFAGLGGSPLSGTASLFQQASVKGAGDSAAVAGPELAKPSPAAAVQKVDAVEATPQAGPSATDAASRLPALPPVPDISGAPAAHVQTNLGGSISGSSRSAVAYTNDPIQIVVTPGPNRPTATLSAKSARPGQIADYVESMMKRMRNEFSSLQDVFNQPITVPNIPGGKEFAETAQRMMQLQITSLNYQLEMGAAEQVRSTGKAVLDKFTEMKD